MSLLNRRSWIQNSLLASSSILVGGVPPVFTGLIENGKLQTDEYIKLNWNENPYGPSPGARIALVHSVEWVNRYPDAKVEELKQRLADRFNLNSSNILLTAGSTEVLSLLGQHVGLQGGEILIPWPSFPTMIRFGERFGATIRKVPLNEEYQIDLDKVYSNIRKDTALVFICNPNNPTGRELPAEELASFCQQVPPDVLICIDEAYIEYSLNGEKSTMAGLVENLANLVVCRTFSKVYGLAGLRIGYAISHESNITALRSRHTGWELSVGWSPLFAAEASLKDTEFVNTCIEQNRMQRQRLYETFGGWGVSYSPSSANFIYTNNNRFYPDVVKRLQEHKILITQWPDMRDHIRISLGKPDDMSRFLEVLRNYLS